MCKSGEEDSRISWNENK